MVKRLSKTEESSILLNIAIKSIVFITGEILMVGYIYYIGNTINSKLYVGKTLSPITKRFQEHCNDSRREQMEHRPLYSAMRKYGEDKFSVHLLEEVDSSLLVEREMYWIQKLDTYKNGYNATHGGDGKILYGADATTSFINDFVNGMSIRKIMKKYGCSKEIVTNRLRSAGINTQQNKIHNKIKINQYDYNGDFIQSFQSISAAAQYLVDKGLAATVSCATSNIWAAAQGKRKTCRGYIWQYAN